MELDIHWNKEWNIPTVAAAVSFGIGGAIGYGISQYRTRKARQIMNTIQEVLDDAELDDNNLQLPFIDTSQMVDGDDIPSIVFDETFANNGKPVGHVENVQVTEEGFEAEFVFDDQETAKTFVSDIADRPITSLEIPVEVYEQVTSADGEEEQEDHIQIDVPEEGTEIVVGEPNSIWNKSVDGWDYDEELAKRTSDAPYIIHKDEFDAEEAGYSQSTLTFYAGDQVLVDERDVPIYDAGNIIGEPIFGHGSQDQSICYIRNDRLEAEYEILLEEGYYQVQVLGAQIEHSFDSKKVPLRKFRD